MIRNCLASLLFLFFANNVLSQIIPSPKEHFGFNIGDDYQLANYTQTEAYFKKLAAVSDRVKLVDMGQTEEGRSQYMVIVSSPSNLKELDKYKQISQRLARAEGLTDKEARDLAATGKVVVWIDGGLHATETVGTHQLIETLWQVVHRKDDETIRILDNAIILFVHANPDGQELVSDWYMKDTDVKKRNLRIPRLYEKYIGHDNNRDFFMMNVKETQNMSRQQYLEWMPQIIYNHHQPGPPGSVLAGPPYRDPFNYVYDPLIISGLDAIGAAMTNRLNAEDKPGYTQRTGSPYSTWWNGGLRTTGYYHNIIGILTEMIGNPTPAKIPLVPSRLIPAGTTPNPVTPQTWHFRQSIEYSISLNYAVLNYAVNQKRDLLYGIYRMGKNSIQNGSKDHWTLSPRNIDSVLNVFKKNASPNTISAYKAGDTVSAKYFDVVLKDRSLRDPRGYIISADQSDFSSAIKFLNALIRSGIKIHRATADFIVEGKKYPAGSYIVKTAQAFRPHVIDMFEPQDHPNDFAYPGGPPVAPYDAAGWTLAYTMGIRFDRLLEDFSGPFEAVPYGELQSFNAKLNVVSGAAGYLLDANNAAFLVVNDLLKSGAEVYRLTNGITGQPEIYAGTFYVGYNAASKKILDAQKDLSGIKLTNIRRPENAKKVSPSRIALWDMYGGSMPSGWLRFILEQHHFSYKVIFPQEINDGDLRSKYDIILFPGGAIPGVGTRGGAATVTTPPLEYIPAEFRSWTGRITADSSIPKLKQFLEDGGDIVAIGSSTNLAYHLKLPVKNALTEMNSEGNATSLPRDKYFIPGSILRVSIDSTQSAAWGMASQADVYFDESPVFRLTPEAMLKGIVKPIAWFSSDRPLRSGWAWGQGYLKDGVAAFVASVGKGRLYAFGPEITFRSQTHGTFRMLFNELYVLK